MRRQGFTLLEVLIAVSLFAVGMMSIIQIFPLNRRLLRQSANTSQAAFLAQEEIEIIRDVDYDSLTTGTYEAAHAMGTAGDQLVIFSRSTAVSLIDSNRAATNSDVGLKKIVVTVTWTERNVARTYSLATYAYNH